MNARHEVARSDDRESVVGKKAKEGKKVKEGKKPRRNPVL
jgi:hypothetical protein